MASYGEAEMVMGQAQAPGTVMEPGLFRSCLVTNVLLTVVPSGVIAVAAMVARGGALGASERWYCLLSQMLSAAVLLFAARKWVQLWFLYRHGVNVVMEMLHYKGYYNKVDGKSYLPYLVLKEKKGENAKRWVFAALSTPSSTSVASHDILVRYCPRMNWGAWLYGGFHYTRHMVLEGRHGRENAEGVLGGAPRMVDSSARGDDAVFPWHKASVTNQAGVESGVSPHSVEGIEKSREMDHDRGEASAFPSRKRERNKTRTGKVRRSRYESGYDDSRYR